MKATGRDLALAVLSAGLLILSFPKFDLGGLAWVGLVPLLVAVDGKRPRTGFLLAFASGLIFFPGILHWIFSVGDYNLLDHVLLGLYLAGYFGLFGLALAWIRQRVDVPMVLAAPPVWVALEYLRAHASILTFPWLLLGYSQYLHPSVVQITSLTGVYGLSFLIVLTNALGADLYRHWKRCQEAGSATSALPIRLVACIATVGILLVFTYVYGRSTLSGPLPDERIRVTVVQGNVPQQSLSRPALIERYATLTRRAAQSAPALIVWPETAMPGDIKHDRALKQQIDLLALETGRFLLVGASEYAKFSNSQLRTRELAATWYNSLFLVSPNGGIDGEYRKIALVPFGEYEPLKGIIRWPKFIAAGFGNALPGQSYTVFSVEGHRFGAVICWEIIFPDLFREFVRRGATFMISATNESWFGATAAPYQLLAMTTIRAAENRVAIARAANTGVSAFVDPYGRITDRVKDAGGRDLFVEGVLSQDVPISRAPTFYARHGDIFAFLQLMGSAALLACSWSSPRRPR